jgi:hypothetical protein
MTEPDKGRLVIGQRTQVGLYGRDGSRRCGTGRPVTVLLQHFQEGSIFPGDDCGDEVLKAAIAIMRGMPDALEAGAGRGLAKNRKNGHALGNNQAEN